MFNKSNLLYPIKNLIKVFRLIDPNTWCASYTHTVWVKNIENDRA